MFDIGILVSSIDDDYDACYPKCGNHKMNEQQKIYYQHIGGRLISDATNHFVCFIEDEVVHVAPVVKNRLTVSSIRVHLLSHSLYVQRYVLLSYFGVFYIYIC